MTANISLATSEYKLTQGTGSTALIVDNKPVNSIYTVQEQGASEQTSAVVETSKLDELLEKMCVELNNSQVTPDKLKKSGILYRITGCNEAELLKKPDFILKGILECLKEAINDSSVDGEIDLERVGTLSNKYYVAINTGWKISDYKKHNNTESLDARLERFFGLDKKDPPVKLSSLPQEKIDEYVERYFHGYFLEKIEKGMLAAKAYRMQLRDFGALLNNTSDEDKAIFKTAIKSLCIKNQDKGLEAVLMSFETDAASTEWADSWTVEEIDELKNEPDVEGKYKSEDEMTQIDITLARKQSIERRAEIMQERVSNAVAFCEGDAKEKLPVILEKIKVLKEVKDINVIKSLLTEDEFQIYSEYTKHESNLKSEYIVPFVHSEYTSEKRDQVLDYLSRKTFDLPIYKSVLEDVNKYISENPDVLNLSYEELVNVLDKATNGNFSIIASGEDKPLNPPAEIKTSREGADSDSDLGYASNDKSENKARLVELTQEVLCTQQVESGFVVEKVNNQENDVEKTTDEKQSVQGTYQQRALLFRSGDISFYKSKSRESSFSIAKDIFVNIGDACQKAQDFAKSYLENASFTMQKFLLNGISFSQEAMKVAATTVDLSKFNLNLSVTTEKVVEKIQEQRV